jgi:hypothetical protein
MTPSAELTRPAVVTLSPHPSERRHTVREPRREESNGREEILRELLDEAHARIRVLERAIQRLQLFVAA